jgi:hypothetical protein
VDVGGRGAAGGLAAAAGDSPWGRSVFAEPPGEASTAGCADGFTGASGNREPHWPQKFAAGVTLVPHWSQKLTDNPSIRAYGQGPRRGRRSNSTDPPAAPPAPCSSTRRLTPRGGPCPNESTPGTGSALDYAQKNEKE